eukprot:742011-Amphidinium_carterae.1
MIKYPAKVKRPCLQPSLQIRGHLLHLSRWDTQKDGNHVSSFSSAMQDEPKSAEKRNYYPPYWRKAGKASTSRI